MYSIREMNFGHAMTGAEPDLISFLEMIGQGDAIKVCAGWYSRLVRSTGRKNVDIEMYPILKAASLALIAAKHQPLMTNDKLADLIMFIIERGMGYLERKS